MSKYHCKLLPYTKIECLSIQEAKQKSGWGITAFDLPKAWQHSQGEGVVIGVCDSGCNLNHEDLKDNLLDGVNFINPGSSPEDDNGHGTAVTGVLVAENNDIGMVGVCPKAKVRPIKVLDKNGNGDLLNVASGVRWAVEQKVDLITMSLGSRNKVQQVRKAIQYATERNIPVFVAAGNAGNTKEIMYPANYPETIAVGAIDEHFKRAKFSCTGYELDFMAPGVDIFSTVPDNWYGTLSGTSFACPFAVGVAALLLACVRGGKTTIKLDTIDDYRNAFRLHTIPIEDADHSEFYEGFGIIDPRILFN